MKVTVIPMVVGTLGTVSKGIEKKKTKGSAGQKKNRDRLDHSTIMM